MNRQTDENFQAQKKSYSQVFLKNKKTKMEKLDFLGLRIRL